VSDTRCGSDRSCFDGFGLYYICVISPAECSLPGLWWAVVYCFLCDAERGYLRDNGRVQEDNRPQRGEARSVLGGRWSCCWYIYKPSVTPLAYWIHLPHPHLIPIGVAESTRPVANSTDKPHPPLQLRHKHLAPLAHHFPPPRRRLWRRGRRGRPCAVRCGSSTAKEAGRAYWPGRADG
jgi:hypothetical protein